ncbi:MAG: Veg family protein [Clostridium paraputrificum]
MYVKKDILKLRELLLSLVGKEIRIREDKSGKGLKIRERRYLICGVSENFFIVRKIESDSGYRETYSFNSILSEDITMFLNNGEELKGVLKKDTYTY